MSRHLRNSAHPAPNPVSSYPVAPDHYAGSLPYVDDTPGAMPIREWVKLQPYQAGDVVWLEVMERDGTKVARLAYVAFVFVEYDRYGDRRAKYRVHVANKAGDGFSKNFVYTYPGYIQRGYKLASNERAEA